MGAAPKPLAGLRSRTGAVATLGFLLNVVGAVGGPFYLEPAQKAEDQAAQDAVRQAAEARMIRAASAFDELAMHMGSLVFSVSVPAGASDDVAAAIHDIRTRALERRHDGVRGYLAELGVAGAIDYPSASRAYESLVAAERVNLTLETYRAANAFEGDLSNQMVAAEGQAAMKAITLQRDRLRAKSVARARRLALTLVAFVGSAIVFVVTMAGVGPPRSQMRPETRILALALKRLRKPEASAA